MISGPFLKAPVCPAMLEDTTRVEGGPCPIDDLHPGTNTASMVRRWLRTMWTPVLLKRQAKRLRLTETVSLGEKRFVAILQVDGSSFLIGGGSAGVSLLKQLEPDPPSSPCFETALHATLQEHIG